MKAILLGALLRAVSAAPVTAAVGFFSYGQWSQLNQPEREAYIAGAIDSYMIIIDGIGTSEQRQTAAHYADCMKAARFSNMDIAERMKVYADTHPASQRGSVIGALIDYLAVLCR
jgi:hypothetical protein